jgi:hypothetical protein
VQALEPIVMLVTFTSDTIGWPVKLVKLKVIVIFWLADTNIGFEFVGFVIARL